MAQDVRYGLRGLRRQAGYALAVIVTMALGIGANTAIFSVVNAVVLQPLPYARGEDLLLLSQARTDVDNAGFSFADIDDIKRASSASLDAVVEYHNMYFILLGGEEPERVATGVVSWDYFQTLGDHAALGRAFRADDDGARRPRRRWSSATSTGSARFSGSPDVVGRVVEMNDRPHTIVGVLPDVPMYPAAERRLHAALGVSVSDERRRTRTAWQRNGVGARPPSPRSDTRARAVGPGGRSGSGCRQAHPKFIRAERGYAARRRRRCAANSRGSSSQRSSSW